MPVLSFSYLQTGIMYARSFFLNLFLNHLSSPIYPQSNLSFNLSLSNISPVIHLSPPSNSHPSIPHTSKSHLFLTHLYKIPHTFTSFHLNSQIPQNICTVPPHIKSHPSTPTPKCQHSPIYPSTSSSPIYPLFYPSTSKKTITICPSTIYHSESKITHLSLMHPSPISLFLSSILPHIRNPSKNLNHLSLNHLSSDFPHLSLTPLNTHLDHSAVNPQNISHVYPSPIYPSESIASNINPSHLSGNANDPSDPPSQMLSIYKHLSLTLISYPSITHQLSLTYLSSHPSNPHLSIPQTSTLSPIYHSTSIPHTSVPHTSKLSPIYPSSALTPLSLSKLCNSLLHQSPTDLSLTSTFINPLLTSVPTIYPSPIHPFSVNLTIYPSHLNSQLSQNPHPSIPPFVRYIPHPCVPQHDSSPHLSLTHLSLTHLSLTHLISSPSITDYPSHIYPSHIHPQHIYPSTILSLTHFSGPHLSSSHSSWSKHLSPIYLSPIYPITHPSLTPQALDLSSKTIYPIPIRNLTHSKFSVHPLSIHLSLTNLSLFGSLTHISSHLSISHLSLTLLSQDLRSLISLTIYPQIFLSYPPSSSHLSPPIYPSYLSLTFKLSLSDQSIWKLSPIPHPYLSTIYPSFI
ncbi:unnamed protein product [Acanthosepion pharaonis]|uniref:Uncharacterized protein n=1 Tax=Acanthosepion pharaonis TaxID=158019 RepID=A0A812EZ04_ACAPH|nr:unnamed protein product [Sepia pharaonis]